VRPRSPVSFSRILLAIAIALTFLPLGPHADALELQPVPEVTAKAVYSVDIDAGVELYKMNEDEELEPASITKLATALLLVQNQDDLSETVTIEQQDLADEGESNMALQTGDIVTFEELLYGLLLPSGNDAANAVARVLGGSMLADEGNEGADPVARFVEEMNALAKSLKMSHTTFLNPSGLHADGHVTSARDMAVLARKTFTQKIIKSVIQEPSFVVTYEGANPREATIETTVTMKKDGVEGVIGGKTGTTPESGACLVLETQESGGNRIITVLLGSEISFDENGFRDDSTDQRYADVTKILDQMNRDYQWIDVSKNDAVPGLQEELSVWLVDLDNKDSIVVPNAGRDSVSYLLQLGPETEPGSQVGRVLFFIDAEQVAERAVVQLPPGGQASFFNPAA